MVSDLEKISEYFVRIKDKKEMKIFLDGILTDAEREDIAKRIRIVEMLKEGVSQRKIVKATGVGIATVTRGARELKAGKFDTAVWRDFKSWRTS